MNVLTVSVTEPGRAIAGRLPYRHAHGDAAATVRQAWGEVDALVLVLAVGAAVRIVGPLLSDKRRDPAVVCVDDAGRFVVALSGGHARGANALTTEVADRLGAVAVVTTATDALGVPALDQLPGLRAVGALAEVTSALLSDEPVRLYNPRAWPVPPALEERCQGGDDASCVIEVSDGRSDAGLGGRRVVLRPPSLVVGVGCSSDATPEEARNAVSTVLREAGLSSASVSALATIDTRCTHPAVTAVVEDTTVPLFGFTAEQLAPVPVPNPSPVVEQAVGTPSVCEAAALLAAGPDATLAVTKTASARVTVAVARRVRPPGVVAVVGLGPGDAAHRTPDATRAVRHADVVVGYTAYVDQCADLLGPAHQVERFPLGAELERAERALELATGGRRVALVCSGDAGVYAMASPLLELTAEARFATVDVEVVPGVTAGQAASAVLGAPLGHDHAVVSLSDLHTPWAQIERRLHAAADGDFVLVLYNPRSQRRQWQLEKAKGILLSQRPPGTPVGLVTDAMRPGQQVMLTTLADLPCDDVTMTTCVVIGASTSTIVNGRMVTPRGYGQ